MSIASDTAAMFADRYTTVAVQTTHGGRTYRTRGPFGVVETYEDAGGLQVAVRRNAVNVQRGAIGRPPVDTLVIVDGARYRVLAVQSGGGDGATEVVVLGVAR